MTSQDERNGTHWHEETVYNDDGNSGYYSDVKMALHRYVVPIIIVTGLFGNSVSFLVFVFSHLRRVSTSVHLAALAFSDTGFLVCLGVGWLESFKVRFFHTEGICQMTVYASYVFSFTSIWFVNAFTAEMYVAVFHPRKSPSLCTPSNARKVVISLTAVAALLYIYVFWLAKVVPYNNATRCVFILDDANTALTLAGTDTILTLVVPFTMIIFMITRLLIHITTFYRAESESFALSTGSEANTEISTNTNPSMRQAHYAHAKLTRMLVVTVLVFLVLNLPSHAIKVHALFRKQSLEISDAEGVMQEVFQILYYANFSINFWLYSACAKSFRSALLRLPTTICSSETRVRLLFTTILQTLKLKKQEPNEQSDDKQVQPHSRLVDINLSDFRMSEVPSIDIVRSPPCLIRDDEGVNRQLLRDRQNYWASDVSGVVQSPPCLIKEDDKSEEQPLNGEMHV